MDDLKFTKEALMDMAPGPELDGFIHHLFFDSNFNPLIEVIKEDEIDKHYSRNIFAAFKLVHIIKGKLGFEIELNRFGKFICYVQPWPPFKEDYGFETIEADSAPEAIAKAILLSAKKLLKYLVITYHYGIK